MEPIPLKSNRRSGHGESGKSVVAWSIALVSAVAVAGILFVVHLFLSAYDVAQDLAVLSNKLGTSTLRGFISNSKDAQLIRLSPSALHAYAELEDALAVEDSGDALVVWKSSIEISDEAKAPVATLVDSLIGEKKQIQAVDRELDSVEASLEEVRQQYEALQAKVKGALVGAEAPIAPVEAARAPIEGDNEGTTEESDFSLAFYRDGLLKDLPVIEGIPDNVADEKTLAPFVQNMSGGKPVWKGWKRVAAALEALVPEAAALQTEQATKDEKRQALEEKLPTLESEIRSLTGNIQTAIQHQIRLATVRSLDSRAANVYRSAAPLVSKLGINLPPLHLEPETIGVNHVEERTS